MMNAGPFEELARTRRLLASSPLIPSLEQAPLPLAQALELLRVAKPLSLAERERLSVEVAGIGQLLEGLRQWLASQGALSSGYNRTAELEMGAAGNEYGTF